MHSSHAVPPAEDQGSRRAARGVKHGSKATAEGRSVTAFSSAPVDETKRDKRGEIRKENIRADSGKQNAVGALEQSLK